MFVLDALYNLFIMPIQLIIQLVFGVFYSFTGSIPLTLFLLSFFVSILVLPLYSRAAVLEKRQKGLEQRLEPVVKHLKKTFKGDESFLLIRTYYRQNGYSPLGKVRSSTSLFLQIPFFIAAYRFLYTNDFLMAATFGPIHSLAVPDSLLIIGGVKINELPIVMTLINILAGYIYTIGKNKKDNIKTIITALVFLVILYNSPAGLVLYWTFNNVFSLIKSVIERVFEDRIKSKAAAIEENQKISFSDAKCFLFPSLFLAVFTGVLIPSAFVSDSPLEFVEPQIPVTPLRMLIMPFIISAGLFVVWGGISYLLASKKGKKVISMFMWTLSLVFLADYMLFSKDLGIISTDLVYDEHPTNSYSAIVLNLIIIAGVIIIGLFLFRYKRLMSFISLVLSLMTVYRHRSCFLLTERMLW